MKASQANPVVYFEIPVLDLDRAISFYGAVFGFTFEKEVLDGYEMAFFSFDSDLPGITGALAKGDVYRPTRDGAILYFSTDDIDAVLASASRFGLEILYPRTDNLDYGFAIAEIEDSEGNRIALRQLLK